ncbi:hypothetical protein [Limibacillus sp. MBR-115]|jgi:hypothetical protein|uniref:hypothetical protein n=1 Tax=Limibacillus sp. MBR-115 TaxID=3156465 RepID=UPI00339A741B
MSYWRAIGLYALTYALPTLAIGFFIVIPGSCIDGFNEMTIGFVGAVLGALPPFLLLLWQTRKASVA